MMDRNECMNVKEIVQLLEEVIPPALQEDWDNSGLTIGFENRKVSRILTCLELDMRVVEEAISKGAELIICHHPLIFGGIKDIRDSRHMGNVIIELIRNEISVYSCHTPFDKVSGGNNDALAGLLGLKNVTDLEGNKVKDAQAMLKNPSEMHIGRIGQLRKSLKLSQVIDFCCDELGLDPLRMRVVGDLNDDVNKIGICTGAGAEYAGQAAKMGCEVFITGDLKYHDARDASLEGIDIIDAGHYGTEKIFPAVMKVQLEKILDDDIEIIPSEVDMDPFTVL